MARQPLSAILAAALLTAPSAAHAQVSDPAAGVIDRFDQSLISTMKDAKRLGPQGRYQRLQPAIAQTFDLPVMTRFAVGPIWTTLSPADQQALVRAFTRYTTATYAHNFNGYSGERFTISPQVQTRGPDKLVSTQLTSSGSAPTSLTYRMRQSAGDGWKVIDVYYNGAVSSLTGQRSDFAGTLKSGGAQGLVRKLDSRSNELLTGA